MDEEMVCQQCGSDDLKEITANGEYGMKCRSCGWLDFDPEEDRDD